MIIFKPMIGLIRALSDKSVDVNAMSFHKGGLKLADWGKRTDMAQCFKGYHVSLFISCGSLSTW